MKIQFKYRKLPLALALVTSAVLVAPSYAQEEEPAPQVSGIVGEMLITARKVEESLQDVPVAVSAFTAEQMKKRSIQELDDLALLTPGLSFEDFSNGGFGTPTIRGASQLVITQLEQNVATFLDGVYIPRQYAVDIGTQSVERIEVVKGPQSALYGANAFLGAINYVSPKPDLEEFTGDVGLVLGDDERGDVSGSVSIPLIPGVLAVRLAAASSEYDGSWENFHPNADAGVSPGTDGNLGGYDNKSYQIGIAAEPTDWLNLDIAYHRYDVMSEARAQTRLSNEGKDLNCSFDAGFTTFFGFFAPENVLFCGELPDTPVVQGGGITNTYEETDIAVDPRTYGLDSESEVFRFAFGWDISDSTQLNYQFSQIEGEVFSGGISSRNQVTGDFNPFAFAILQDVTSFPIGEFEYKTHELRLDYTADSGLTAMAGIFLLDGEDLDESGAGAVAVGDLTPITASTFFPLLDLSDGFTETESQAFFGRIEYPLMDDTLRLSAEARYTDEKISNDAFADDYEDDYVTTRLSADYSLSESQLIYVSAAQGVKSGGLNSASFPLEEFEKSYGPDENTTYELGYKGTLADGRLQLNAAAYLIDWSDLQITVQGQNAVALASGIVQNIGSAESTGIEAELIFAVTEGLTFNVGYAYTDATYDSGTIAQRITAIRDGGLCFKGVVCNEDGDIGGNTLPRSPETQWNVGAQYDGIISDGLDFFLRADVVGQSKQYVSELNLATISSRELVNLRGGISSQDGWSAELWVKNAADEEYVSNAFFIATDFGIDYVPTYGNRRQVGVTLGYSF